MAPDDWDPLVIPPPPKPFYHPAQLGVRSYLLDIYESIALFNSRVREYQQQHPKYVRIRPEQYNPYPVMDVIAQHVFSGPVCDSLVVTCAPLLDGLGLDRSAVEQICSEVLMVMIAAISELFPELRFSDGLNVTCNAVDKGLLLTTMNRLE